jgi:DNA ligase D-like protein (predicted 3'-phosphoesterase)
MPTKKLATYHAKRNFSKTTEPRGALKSKANHTFVVQRHDASHLHYDFRLEVDGVLKSWAIPKGMPKTYAERRLAVQTEDHPLEYAHFSGTIPEGEYGAGTVKIWDEGTYEQIISDKKPQKDMPSAIKDGSIKFHLSGKRYNGNYALIRFKQEGKKSNWLIFKVPKNA